MRPSTIVAALWGFAVGVVMFALFVYVAAHLNDKEDTGIPTPPSGYTYCTTEDGQGLMFCPKRRFT